MTICGLQHDQCDYQLPTDYNPQYGMYDAEVKTRGEDRAPAIIQNCLALAFKESLYVDSDGTLQGYSRYNLFGRIYRWISNWSSDGAIDKAVTAKIEETFTFILGIRSSHGLISDRKDCYGDCHLTPTSVHFKEKNYHSYTWLAEKVIQKYPRESNPALYHLAHRILHERATMVLIERDGLRGEVLNVASKVRGTPFEATTVWDLPPSPI